jgi:PIN domain nuclease of toxin-antitoxin system
MRTTATPTTAVETLPTHHRDPFDRMLVVQCQIEQIPLVSADVVFDRYGITRLWSCVARASDQGNEARPEVASG